MYGNIATEADSAYCIVHQKWLFSFFLFFLYLEKNAIILRGHPDIMLLVLLLDVEQWMHMCRIVHCS